MLTERGLSPKGVEKGPQTFYLLNSEQIHHHWGNIEACLAQVPQLLRYYDPMDIYERAIKGHMSIWTIGHSEIEGIIATQILVFPKMKVFQIFAAQGEGMLEFIVRGSDVMDKVAAINGCGEIQVFGRPGWKRVLKPFGAEVEHYVLTRAVSAPKEM